MNQFTYHYKMTLGLKFFFLCYYYSSFNNALLCLGAKTSINKLANLW